MVRAFSTFSLSAWGAFHAVSALFYALAISEGGGLLLLSIVTGGGASLLALCHAALAGLCALVVVHLQTDTDIDRAELRGLLALAGGLGVTIFAAASGHGAESPGVYAAFVAATLAGLTFDRWTGSDSSEEVDEADHRAFMRLAAELGADARGDGNERQRR